MKDLSVLIKIIYIYRIMKRSKNRRKKRKKKTLKQKGGNKLTISYINFWKEKDEDKYLSNFIKTNIFKNITFVDYKQNPDILICGSNGSFNNKTNEIKHIKSKSKIFYNGENLSRFSMFNEDFLQNTFDLIIDFKDTDIENKYVKFPLWLCFYSYYNYTKENNLLNYLQTQYNKNINKQKNKFATLVSRHDREGQRDKISNELQQYGKIYYGGPFKNNIGYNIDNKIDFLSDSIYNICPENSSAKGYCTEKIFQAFEGGTIPIYWGNDLPEKNIINVNKYCFCNIDNNIKLKKQIEDVVLNIPEYSSGSLFTEQAPIYISKYYTDLTLNLKRIINEFTTIKV